MERQSRPFRELRRLSAVAVMSAAALAIAAGSADAKTLFDFEPIGPAPSTEISSLEISPSAFRASKPPRRGPATIRFELTAPGTVALRVIRRTGSLDSPVGPLKDFEGSAGMNKLPFSGRVSGRRLRPGRYGLFVMPVHGTTSRTVFFTIKK